MQVLNTYKNQIADLCKKYNVKKLYAFGSVLRSDFNKTSDIDLVVDFDDVPLKTYADNYFDFIYKLEDLFRRKVDLIENKAIKNPYFKEEVDKNKVLIYG
jgi:predicted nucleotidyltransferase